MKGDVFALGISAIVVSSMAGIKAALVIQHRKIQRLKESPDQWNQDRETEQEILRGMFRRLRTTILYYSMFTRRTCALHQCYILQSRL